jgi:hypothetical protein
VIRHVIPSDRETLQKRLRSLPTDLEEYFLRMIRRVDAVYQSQSAQIFLLVVAARRPLALRSFDFLVEDAIFGLRKQLEYLPHSNETRATQLKARGADLVELVPHHGHPELGLAVMFIHRTVYDFLTTDAMQTFLRKGHKWTSTRIHISPKPLFSR